LPGDIPADERVLDKCRRLKDLGYRLALDGLPEAGALHPLAPLLDYLILDYRHPDFSDRYAQAKSGFPGLPLVFDNIPDTASYQRLAGQNPQGFFTGAFYNSPITEGNSSLSPVKVNTLQLLNQINSDDFELDAVVRIIERDPYLTISLLRFINSAAVGLKRKVDSIKSAVAILGQKELKRWAVVAISISLAEDRPGEITKLTLMRAKFAENLAPAFALGLFQSSLFMVGLFSLLDVILQKPMSEAIKEVAVEDRVRRTLAQKEGNLYTVLDFIYTYERADWDRCSVIMIQNGVEFEAVSRAFLEATLWYYQLLAIIDKK
jgi:EAL and modified HD-GYP domain-containing signal transduction protein